jgi:hypothetical protein
MNQRLSVSTIAYLAQQEELAQKEKLEEALQKIKLEKERQEQAEALKKRNALPYSEPLAIEICERISCGELLINICNDEHLPTTRRFYQWLGESAEFNMLYKESLNDRLNIFEEQLIQIADDASRDFKDVVRNGRTVRVLDGDAIARAKLRVEVRFRHLKAYRPQRWGDVSTLITKDADASDPANLSNEELERRLADLDVKDRIVRPAAA